MNFENMNVLSQKIEGVLGTVRILKEDNAKLRQQLSFIQAELQDKSMLLDSANEKLADATAALDARANQAAAQADSISAMQGEVKSLNEQINEKNVIIDSLNGQVGEKNGIIDSLNEQINEKNVIIDSLNGQVGEKNVIIDSLNGQVAEKNGIIDSLNGQVAEKNSVIDDLNRQINDKLVSLANLTEQVNSLQNQNQAQANEFAEAQEKFNNLLSTIESELGTELPVAPVEPIQVEPQEIDEGVTEGAVEQETAADEAQQPAEDDIPTIEGHGADEEEKPSAGQGGQQPSFFD